MEVTGLIAAPFVALHENGDLNLDRVEAQAHRLVADGVQAAFICGTTGEGASLTTEERRALAQRWCEARPDGLRVLVHAGHASMREAQALASHAQAVGADGVAAVAPYFFKPSTAEQLARFCHEMAAAAPALPFFYYHMPAMTGVDIPMAQLLRSLGDEPANFAGIKFTHENLMDFSQCLEAAQGRYQMLFGRDEILLTGLALGARAAVGSSYNFAGPLYCRLMDAFAQGDLNEARRLQAIGRRAIQIIGEYGGLSAAKSVMKLVDIDCGPPRWPLTPPTESQQRALGDRLRQLGLFEPALARAGQAGIQ